jgi:hypothetical protein
MKSEDEELLKVFQVSTILVHKDGDDEIRAMNFKRFKAMMEFAVEQSYKAGLKEGIKRAEGLVQQAIDRVPTK